MPVRYSCADRTGACGGPHSSRSPGHAGHEDERGHTVAVGHPAWHTVAAAGGSDPLRLGEDGSRDPAHAVGVADTVDLDDLAAHDGEGQD